MGIRIKDFVDPTDFDVVEDVLTLLEITLMDEDLTEQQQQQLEEAREATKTYVRERDQLHAKAYQTISLWLYQTDERKLFSEAEFLTKLRELKEDTKKQRAILEEANRRKGGSQ